MPRRVREPDSSALSPDDPVPSPLQRFRPSVADIVRVSRKQHLQAARATAVRAKSEGGTRVLSSPPGSSESLIVHQPTLPSLPAVDFVTLQSYRLDKALVLLPPQKQDKTDISAQPRLVAPLLLHLASLPASPTSPRLGQPLTSCSGCLGATPPQTLAARHRLCVADQLLVRHLSSARPLPLEKSGLLALPGMLRRSGLSRGTSATRPRGRLVRCSISVSASKLVRELL